MCNSTLEKCNNVLYNIVPAGYPMYNLHIAARCSNALNETGHATCYSSNRMRVMCVCAPWIDLGAIMEILPIKII